MFGYFVDLDSGRFCKAENINVHFSNLLAQLMALMVFLGSVTGSTNLKFINFST